MARRGDLPRSVQAFLAAVGLAGVACAYAVARCDSLHVDAETTLMLLCGVLFARRSIRIGPRVHVSASHPFVFAALVLDGPSTALALSCVNVVAAALQAGRRMQLYQVLFNLASASICIGVAWSVYVVSGGPRAFGAGLESAVLPALFASVGFYVPNGWLVAAVIGLERGVSIVKSFRENVLWSGPSFLVGGCVGLLAAHLLRTVGVTSVLASLPFCYLIFSTYRLYMERMNERKERLEQTTHLNEELESRVAELAGLNRELKTAHERESEANRLKSEFLANISHELRTPLNAIIGFSELLRGSASTRLKPRESDALDDIHGSGKNLLALIEDLLDLSSVEAGRMQIRPEPCWPGVVANDVLVMMRAQSDWNHIKFELEEQGEPVTIRADPVRLRRILWNLLANAAKFSPAGGRVLTSLSYEQRGVAIKVEDEGIGISQEQQGKIFHQFYQVDGSHSRRRGGTGLGLALVKRFVTMHGGRISLESEPGRGSAFTVHLPCQGPDRMGGTVPAITPRQAALRRAS